jgi:hypothetical protein
MGCGDVHISDVPVKTQQDSGDLWQGEFVVHQLPQSPHLSYKTDAEAIGYPKL